MDNLTLSVSNLVTFTEAAKLLKVSRPTVYNLVRQNHLHPVVIGKNRYLLRKEVEGIIKR